MTITTADLDRANKSIKTTDIKGKDYAEVNQRIKAFRMLCPNGTISTEIVSLENGVCIIKASVFDDDKLLGTGTAYEKEGSTFINKTSYIENCETSAVGRALGMLGIGIDASVASYEEVANAQKQQKEDEKKPAKDSDDYAIAHASEPITATQGKTLKKVLDENGIDTSYLLDCCGTKKLTDITNGRYLWILQNIATLKEKYEAWKSKQS